MNSPAITKRENQSGLDNKYKYKGEQMLHRKLVVFVILSVMASAPHAAIIYTYSGSSYSTILGDWFTEINYDTAYATSMRVTGSITLAESLGALHDIATPVTPIAFSLNDGVNTLTHENTDSAQFYFQTNALGTIVDWQINAATAYPQPTSLGDLHFSIFTSIASDSGKINECMLVSSIIPGFCSMGRTIDGGSNHNSPGTWAVTAVPVPPTLWLFASGLIALLNPRSRREAKP